MAASVKANARASRAWSSGPERSTYRPITPSRTAPTWSGNANTARAPAASAAGVKIGQRAPPARRSSARTGRRDANASMHGPSPRVNCSSSSASPVGSDTAATPDGPASVISRTQQPLTTRSRAAAAQTRRSSATTGLGAGPVDGSASTSRQISRASGSVTGAAGRTVRTRGALRGAGQCRA